MPRRGADTEMHSFVSISFHFQTDPHKVIMSAHLLAINLNKSVSKTGWPSACLMYHIPKKEKKTMTPIIPIHYITTVI